MRLTRTLLLLGLALATPAMAQRRQNARQNARPSGAISIPFEKITLRNGLTVILSPNHSTPTVTVNVWYHVGSKNEARGRTGFAHVFEHVMFTGSGNVPYGLHDRLTQGVGGENNATTTQDRTNYYENIPSNYLETALWMEADRMGFLLDKLDSAKFIAQREIVQNERRARVDDQPYGRAFELIAIGLYPDTNPYSWPIGGYMADLRAATLEDVKEFFRLYYAPGNATISIVGDFDSAQARQWVAKYFGDLPRGKAIARPAVTPPTVTVERRFTFEDRVQIPRLYVAWPTVGMKEVDSYALNVLSSILTGSRTARLTKALVYDRQSAAQASVVSSPSENVGEFLMILTPRPGHTLTQLEASADSVIERLKHEGPTADELARALAGIEFQFVVGLQSNVGKAETLNRGAVIFGDPGYYRTQYTRIRAVTQGDVKQVANTYLGPGRVVVSIVPVGKPDLASKSHSSTKVTVAPDGGKYVMGSR